MGCFSSAPKTAETEPDDDLVLEPNCTLEAAPSLEFGTSSRLETPAVTDDLVITSPRLGKIEFDQEKMEDLRTRNPSLYLSKLAEIMAIQQAQYKEAYPENFAFFDQPARSSDFESFHASMLGLDLEQLSGSSLGEEQQTFSAEDLKAFAETMSATGDLASLVASVRPMNSDSAVSTSESNINDNVTPLV